MFALIDMIIVRPITNILFLIYSLVGDFGVAIILFTVLVKVCMWPLMKRQLHQTRLMRKIQPELTEIRKNCNGNKQLESLQTMDLYKRYNIKPFRSIVTLVIQLPILIALYTAVRVMVLPTPTDNLMIRAYEPVAQMERIEEVINMQEVYLNQDPEAEEKHEYDFHPNLLNIVNLDAKAGITSIDRFIVLLFALATAATQFWVARQQMPSKKKGGKTFRQIMQEAAEGKEPDQSELNQIVSGQMSFMMPVFMLLIMINLPGALAFYYMISNLMTLVLQRYILNKSEREMDDATDKEILRELKKVQEAEIVGSDNRWLKNKNSAKSESGKSGVKITRISAKSHRGLRGHKKKRS